MKPASDPLVQLGERTARCEPGERVALGDLAQSDRYGAAAFAALAARFGAAATADGGWAISKQPRWRPGWVYAADEAMCLDLFESAFGYRMDARLWRWKYRDANPLGVGVWQGER